MALFIYMLPSLIRTVDCGFRYEYVLGYDKGDQFYDTDEGKKMTEEWYSLTYSLTHSFTHSLTHSLTHSPPN
jgi:hypothetical protein